MSDKKPKSIPIRDLVGEDGAQFRIELANFDSIAGVTRSVL